MRTKDYITIAIGVVTLLTLGYQFWFKPMQLDARMVTIENKYIPMIERNNERVIVLGQQYKEIENRLDYIISVIDKQRK